MKKIAIIGTGRIGKALEYLAPSTKIEVALFDANPEMPRNVESLQEAVVDAEIVFLGVPSWVVRKVMEEASALAPDSALFVALSKGIEENSKKTMDIVLSETVQKNQTFALLSGPTMAEEVVQGGGVAAIVGSEDKGSLEILQELFVDAKILLEYSSDIHSVALSAVLKNIYAMILGIANAMNISESAEGMLLVHIIREMRIILKKLDGDPDMALSLAGLGDMALTGFSPHSRNRNCGKELVETGEISKKSEGFTALPSLVGLLEGDMDDLPLLAILYAVIVENKSAKEKMEEYLDKK